MINGKEANGERVNRK